MGEGLFAAVGLQQSIREYFCNQWTLISVLSSLVQAVTLVSILSLAPNIIGPEITSELIGVTNTLVNLPADARHIGSCLDAPYLLARSIDTILRLGLDDLDSSLFASWLTHIIESSWIHNPHVIGSAVGICEAR